MVLCIIYAYFDIYRSIKRRPKSSKQFLISKDRTEMGVNLII